jgi:hypothetical protein
VGDETVALPEPHGVLMLDPAGAIDRLVVVRAQHVSLADDGVVFVM